MPDIVTPWRNTNDKFGKILFHSQDCDGSAGEQNESDYILCLD